MESSPKENQEIHPQQQTLKDELLNQSNELVEEGLRLDRMHEAQEEREDDRNSSYAWGQERKNTDDFYKVESERKLEEARKKIDESKNF